MNTTFLLIELFVLLATIGGVAIIVQANEVSANHAFGLTGAIVGSIASVVLLVYGLRGNGGSPIVTETTEFSVERTPYRIVVSAFDQETTFKDAYSVANAEHITTVIRTVKRNAWGIELASAPHQPTISPVFGKAPRGQ